MAVTQCRVGNMSRVDLGRTHKQNAAAFCGRP